MQHYRYHSLVLLLALLAQANADETTPTTTINWAINVAPPFHITEGQYKQQGLCDALINTVHRYLPQLKRHRQILPQPRIGQAMERNENVCFPCMILKTQGEKGRFYSQPTHMYRPHQLITNSETAARILQKYPLPVSLSDLLADDSFRFGYPAGRRYGVLQPLIEGQDNRPGNRLVRAGDNGPPAILQMISAGRLDFTIDYSIIKRYVELTTSEQLVMLPIAENDQQPVTGAIGCTNNAWGRNVIEQINAVMLQIRQDNDFQDSQNFWFEPVQGISYQQFNQEHLPAIVP